MTASAGATGFARCQRAPPPRPPIDFGFFASAADGGASESIDYLFVVWALVNGLGFLGVAGLLDRHPRASAAARLLLVSYLVFGVIKIAGYGETEVVGTVAVAVVVLALLQVRERR